MRMPSFSSVPQHGWANVAGARPAGSPWTAPWGPPQLEVSSRPHAASAHAPPAYRASHDRPPLFAHLMNKPHLAGGKAPAPPPHCDTTQHTSIVISPSPTKVSPPAPTDGPGSLRDVWGAGLVGGCAHGQGGYDGVQGALRHGEVTRSVCVVAMVYAERLQRAKAAGHPLAVLEAAGQWCGQCERVGLLVLGCKYVDDVPWRNSQWAVWAGMALARLNHVEAALLQALGFALAVAPADFNACASAYMAALPGHQPRAPTGPAPPIPWVAAMPPTQRTHQDHVHWESSRTAKIMGPRCTWV